MKTPIIQRNVRLATTEETEQAKRDYPMKASLMERGTYYVGFYSDEAPADYWVVESYRNDPYHSTSSGWFGGKHLTSLEAAIEVAKTMKNIRRRIVHGIKTNRWVGSDESGFGCVENGFKTVGVVGSIDYNFKTKKWEYKGVLSR